MWRVSHQSSKGILLVYATIPNLDENTVDVQHVMESTRIHTEECSLLFKRMHEVMREQECELIMFVIIDKNHLQDDLSPTSGPVAFALKGSCLSNKQLLPFDGYSQR